MRYIRPTIDQGRPQLSTLELAMEEIRTGRNSSG